jgi:hypothetical protein
VKKIIGVALLLPLLIHTGQLHAQHNKLADTLLVFTIHSQFSTDTVAFRYITKGRKISWWDKNNERHESKINRFTNEYMVLDTAKVSFDNIKSISTVLGNNKGVMNAIALQMADAGSIIVNGNPNVMTRAEYGKTVRSWNFRKEMKEKEMRMPGYSPSVGGFPGFKKPSSLESPLDQYLKKENKIAWEIAMKDTNRKLFDSVHQGRMYYSKEYNQKRKQRRYLEYLEPHSLTLSLSELLANEVTLTYGYRVNRWLGFEIAPGLYFPTSWKAVPEITYVQYCRGLMYNRSRMNGYQANLYLKFYLPARPNRYIALKGFCRYLYYNDEEVMTWYEPYGDYSCNSVQSEKGWASGFTLLCGWQVTRFKHLTFDFYFGLGAFKRRGEIIEYSGGRYIDNWGHQIPMKYPITYSRENWFPSIQASIKIGVRFGSRKKINQ